MVKHTHKISRQKPTNFLSVFDHFGGFVLLKVKCLNWWFYETYDVSCNRLSTLESIVIELFIG